MQNATFTSSTEFDKSIINLGITIHSYSGEKFTSLRWYVKQVNLSAGKNPSRAILCIPAFSEDSTESEFDAECAALKIKIGMFAKVVATENGASTTLFVGSIVSIHREFNGGDLILNCEDARYLLAGKQATGIFLKESGGLSYVGSLPCVMNPNGQPNCIMVGARYVFCEPNYGLGENAEVPTTPSTTTACYWTVGRALQYFRDVFFHSAFATSAGENSFITQCDANLMSMSESVASKLVDEEFFSTTTRKSQQMDFEAKSADDIFQSLCDMAGPFAINVIPQGSALCSEIVVVRTRYDSGGTTLSMAQSGNASTSLNKPCAISGELSEDGKQLFTRVAVQGDTVYIERRISTVAADSISLMPSWSAEELTAFKADLAVAGNNTASAVKSLFKKYPNLFCAYKIDPQFLLLTNTTLFAFYGDARANRVRKPMGELLSSKAETSSLSYLQQWQHRYKIPIEISFNGTTWASAPENSGMEIRDDGTIMLHGLRQEVMNASTSLGTWRGNTSTPSSIAANEVRMTLAIPTDFRISAARRLSNSYEGSNTVEVYKKASGDTDRIDANLDRLFYVSAHDLYAFHERYNSYPVPPPAGSVLSNTVIRDDSDFIIDHCKRRLSDVGRVKRNGRMVFPSFIFAYELGSKIKEFKTVSGSVIPVRGIVTGINYTCNAEENLTELSIE